MKTVGILGGMGPEATVLLMHRILAAVPARDDADHIPLIVHQNPAVPSRIARLIEDDGEDPAPVLIAMAQTLEAAGAGALAMPCNTAHAYACAIAGAVRVPFLDMRTATVARLVTKGGSGRVGMLASPAVRLTGVFDAAFDAAGLVPVFLRDDARLLAVIRAVKAGNRGAQVQADLRHLAGTLAAQTDHLLIACTELSLLSGALEGPATAWTDSLDCLVEAIVGFAQS